MNSNCLLIETICCIGAGHVGGPTIAVIPDRCPEVQVTVVDLNADALPPGTSLDLSELPEYEPGLDDVVSRARARNLHFSTAVEEVIATADMVFISGNTHHQDEGPGRWPGQCPHGGQSSAGELYCGM